MAIAPKILEHARSASRWLPEALATSIPIWAILGDVPRPGWWRINAIGACVYALCTLVPLAALYAVIWWQADRPMPCAKHPTSASAERWCIAVGMVTLADGLVLRMLWPKAKAMIWPTEAGMSWSAEQAARASTWGLAYGVHSMLVYWVVPSLLGFAIVRRLAGSLPPRGRVARWLLAVGCAAALVAAGTDRATDTTVSRSPLALAFGATALAAFGARLVERRQVATNLLGAAQAMLYIALSIATRVFRARSERPGMNCAAPHPLAFIEEPDTASLHRIVLAVDIITALAAALWLASLAVRRNEADRPRYLRGTWLASLALGVATQLVIVHAPPRRPEPPRRVAQMALPVLRGEDVGNAYRWPVERVDVELASSPPYRVVHADAHTLRWLRHGPIPRATFEAEMLAMGFARPELGVFGLDTVGTDSVRLERLVVAAPASMPLSRLRDLARDLDLGDVRPAFSLVVAIDVRREQPGLDMSPSTVRAYTRFHVRETSEPPPRRLCARVRLDAHGSLRVLAAPLNDRPGCVVDLHVDPSSTVADLVRAIAPYTYFVSYRIDTGPTDDAWLCGGASTARASDDVLESGSCEFR